MRVPSFQQGWPGVLQRLEAVVLVVQERAAGRAGHAGQPDAIGGEHVHERAEDGLVGAPVIGGELLWRELRGGLQQAVGGPGGVSEVRAEVGNGHWHV